MDSPHVEPLRVAEMAPAAGLSTTHFSREFTRTFGESPHHYLLTRRLERAAALLRTTDRPVSRTCFAVGWESIGSFTTSFRSDVRPDPYRLSCGVATRRPIRPDRAVYRKGICPAEKPRFEKTTAERFHRLSRTAYEEDRLIKIANAQFWVHDQDDALNFYTKTLGWEVRADVTMEAWQFRWLVVAPPGQPDMGLVLMPVPGPPMLDADASAALAELVAQGAGGTLFLETDDCRAAFEELSRRGVVFNDPPTVRPYRIDTSFRDPSGNNIRLTQVLEFDPARASA